MAQTPAKKPISKEGLLEAVKLNGLSTQELVERIQQRGVSFQLTAEDEADLRRAGARPELIEAVRANYHSASPAPPPVNPTNPRTPSTTTPAANVPAGPPLSKNEIVTLLQSGASVSRVEQFVEVRGVSFSVTPEIAREIRAAGGNRELIGAITERSAATNAPANSSTTAPRNGNNYVPKGPDYDDLTDQATSAIKANNADLAIRLLNQAVQINPTPATAYSMLGFTELYGKGDITAAETAMRAAIERGGSGAFRVYHDHDGFFNTYCIGSFFVTRAGISYKADDGNHTFETTKADLQEAKVNGFVGSQFGAFHLKVGSGSKGKNYNFAPATKKQVESNLIVKLIQGYK